MEEIGCDRDYIHVLCSTYLEYVPGQSIRVIRSITVRELFKGFPKLRKGLWGGKFGADGVLSDVWATRGLGDCGAVHEGAREQTRECAVEAFVIFRTL